LSPFLLVILPTAPPPCFTLFPYTTLFRSGLVLAEFTLGAANQDVGLDTDGPQFGYRVLGRLGLGLAGRLQVGDQRQVDVQAVVLDRKSTRLNSSHRTISYAVFCLKKKKTN